MRNAVLAIVQVGEFYIGYKMPTATETFDPEGRGRAWADHSMASQIALFNAASSTSAP